MLTASYGKYTWSTLRCHLSVYLRLCACEKICFFSSRKPWFFGSKADVWQRPQKVHVPRRLENKKINGRNIQTSPGRVVFSFFFVFSDSIQACCKPVIDMPSRRCGCPPGCRRPLSSSGGSSWYSSSSVTFRPRCHRLEHHRMFWTAFLCTV